MSLKNEVRTWLAYSRPEQPLSLKDLADLMALQWPQSKSRIYTAVKALGDDVVVVQRGSRRGPLLMTAREDVLAEVAAASVATAVNAAMTAREDVRR